MHDDDDEISPPVEEQDEVRSLTCPNLHDLSLVYDDERGNYFGKGGKERQRMDEGVGKDWEMRRRMMPQRRLQPPLLLPMMEVSLDSVLLLLLLMMMLNGILLGFQVVLNMY